MANQEFDTALLRLIAAESYFLCSMSASRELYGKSYFSLGVAEKQAVDQTVLNAIAANLSSVTPEWLGVADPKQRGFRGPSPDPSGSSVDPPVSSL